MKCVWPRVRYRASDCDPNPVSLKVGTITVDKPIVTNWHTSAQDAVFGDGTDG